MHIFSIKQSRIFYTIYFGIIFMVVLLFSSCKYFNIGGLPNPTNPTTISQVQMCVQDIHEPTTCPALVEPPTKYKVLPDGTLQQIGTLQQPLVVDKEFRWQKAATITVGFYTSETTTQIIEKVKKYASEWMTFTSVKFVFVDDVNIAQIKVGFKPNKTSWSWLGRKVLNNPDNLPTMNFGWFDSTTAEEVFQRTIRHEFGHALGFEHEHQSPAGNIKWNEDSVYKYYIATGWDSATVRRNIFFKYGSSFTNFSVYDPLSIMHYAIPAILITNGFSVGWNTQFSDTDKAFAKRIYETQLPREPDVCAIATGDDCDDIIVTINYPPEPVTHGKVFFQLELGSLNDNLPTLTWWKQIGVPLLGNAESTLSVDGSSIFNSMEVPFSLIDVSKGISFSKAKFLGVHTPLTFKWNIWQAIEPGCKIHLKWRRDSCN